MEGGGDGGDSQAAAAMKVKSPVRPDHGFNLDPPDVSVSSAVTRQKAAAAKQLIENHYKNYLQGLQDRKERRRALQRRAAEAQVSRQIIKIDERFYIDYRRNRRLIGLWLQIGKLFDYEAQTIDEF